MLNSKWSLWAVFCTVSSPGLAQERSNEENAFESSQAAAESLSEGEVAEPENPEAEREESESAIDSQSVSTEEVPPSSEGTSNDNTDLELPEGMTLDEVLDRAAEQPPEHFPQAINDDRLLAFFLADQFEYRVDGTSVPDVLGWEANAWIGGDFNRLWLKPEGEATFHSPGSIESETDVLYSRLVLPFWSAQMGIQYANEWKSGEDYDDRWSGVLAFQGLAPGKFEVDASVYLSENLDVTAQLELEYDWRVTQRFVVQPRTELTFAFQDVPERNLGAGLTDIIAGLRFRYEIKREFAPYLGIRYEGKVFESADRTRDAGEPVWRFFGLAGMRFAFL